MIYSKVYRHASYRWLLILGVFGGSLLSLGEDLVVKATQPKLALDRKYVAPPPFEAPLADEVSERVPKNIILIVGDGMGTGAQRLTSFYQHKKPGGLVMEQLPVAGLCTTRSASSEVTDSAAAATAMACGKKTANGMLGVDVRTNKLVSLAALAQKAGRAVALVTSDPITGATPAGFYAQVPARLAYPKIADCAAASGFEVLIGSAQAKEFFLPKGAGGMRADARDLVAEMTGRDYVVVETATAFAQVSTEKRVLGFLDKASLDPENALGVLMETALARLAKREKGFFLLMEGALTDKAGHANNAEQTVRGTLQVDWAVRKAVDFARTRDDTLVVVIADHETGGLYCNQSRSTPDRLVIQYTTANHTGVPVPLFAFGPGSKAFLRVIDNTDIAKSIARFWNLEL